MNPDRLPVVRDLLPVGPVSSLVGVEFAALETLGKTGLGQKLPGSIRVVRVRGKLN